MSHPKLLRVGALVVMSAGALLLAGSLPAFAVSTLSATGTGTVVSQLPSLSDPLANQPEGVAVANGITYVSNTAVHAVDRFDASGAFLSRIALPGGSPYPTSIVASSDGSHIYVTDGNATGSVFSIVTSTNAVTAFPVVGAPFAITLSPDGGTFYVISNNDALVYAYATADGTALGHSTSDGLYATAFHVMASPDGSKLYETMRDPIPAPGQTTGGLRILNASDLSEIGHVDLANASGLAESADGSKIWVGSTDAAFQSVVAEFDALGTFSRSVAVRPEPESLIVSPDGKWIYAGSLSTGLLDVVDTSGFGDTATAMTLGDIRQLALSADGLRLYSANGSGGNVQVVSIAQLTLTSPATVLPGAGTTTFSAQIADGSSPIADYTTNSVVFDILNASNAVVATATVAPDSSGAASAGIDLSALPRGTYSVRATLDPIAGAVVVTATGFTVADPTALAPTGSDAAAPALVALSLLLLGTVLLVLLRRRPTA